MFDPDGDWEPYEDDLQTFSDNEAWQDAQAEMESLNEGDEPYYDEERYDDPYLD